MRHLNYLTMALLVMLFAASAHVFAADLQSAKSAGWVGEQLDGYVGLVDPKAPADIKALVQTVNQKRRNIYQQLANKKGVPLADIEKVAGQRNIQRTPKGQYIQAPSGLWVRK
jgi:hypothetical protein